ncbi:hypothetical protein BH10CYA1_BH10CYA1_39180 [soil metagenome]
MDARNIDELGPSYYSIQVLPRNPTVHESLNAQPGSKRLSDQYYAFLCLVINLLLTVAILRDPLRDKKLAQRGQPLFAIIDALKIVNVATAGDQHYMADISYSWDGKKRYHRIHLRPSEYNSLQLGSSEIILYDEMKDQPTLYRFCRYNAVSSSKHAKSAKP